MDDFSGNDVILDATEIFPDGVSDAVGDGDLLPEVDTTNSDTVFDTVSDPVAEEPAQVTTAEQAQVMEQAPEQTQETQYTLDDIYQMIDTINQNLVSIMETQQEINDNLVIAGKNNEFFTGITLGFLIAFFGGFVVYCFLGRLR